MAFIYDGGINTDKISERTSGTGTDINGVLFKEYIIGYLNNVQNIKVNLSAILDPSPSDDSNQSYSPGSIWVNTNNNTAFICVDDTNNTAIWKEISESNIINIGTSGIGVFKQKTGADFELKKLNNLSNKISITDDTVNNKIDFNLPLNIIRVYSTTTTSTTSTTFTLINSMSLNLSPGYYLIMFSCYTYIGNYSGIYAEFGLRYYIGGAGSVMNETQRKVHGFSHAQNADTFVHTATYAWIDGSGPTEANFRTSVSGTPIYVKERFLYVIKISD